MQPEKETVMQKNPKPEIERVGAGGEIGNGQSGTPLHKSHGIRDRELGKRERVGAGGEVGNGQSGTPLHTPG
jgi:hypothetical protein